MMNYAPTHVKTRPLNLLNNCCQRKNIPDNWEKTRTRPMFKKGDRSICDNYRGISLLKQLNKR